MNAENRELRGEIEELRSATWVDREDSMSGFGTVAEVAIPAGPAAPGAARTILAACLPGIVAPRVLEDAQLLVTELVTNSVVHGELEQGDAVLVRAYVAGGALRLEVENSGIAGVVASNGADPRDGRGLGLQLVEHLVTDWGVRRGHSTTVWLEMIRG